MTQTLALPITSIIGRGALASLDKVGPATIENTSVTAGSYTTADITVDAQGRITAVASGSGGAGSPLVLTASVATELPLEIELAASQTEDALQVNSNGGSGGDIFKITSDKYIVASNGNSIIKIRGSVIYGYWGTSQRGSISLGAGSGFDISLLPESNSGSVVISSRGTDARLAGGGSYNTTDFFIIGKARGNQDWDGNHIHIEGGAAGTGGSGNHTGGDLTLDAGVGAGTGSNGNIILSSLPTSDPSVTGALWNDSGTVKISL